MGGWSHLLLLPVLLPPPLQEEMNKGQNETQDRQVLIEYTEQPQALSEQETEATPSAGHPFGSSQEFVRGPPRGFAGMHGATRNDVGVIGRLGSHLAVV